MTTSFRLATAPALALALALLTGAASLHADGLRILLRSTADVSAPFVTIGDVAEVSGESALAGHVRGVFLGLSPDPGAKRTISRQAIADRLASCGLSEEAFRLIGAPRVSVGSRSGRDRPLPRDERVREERPVEAPPLVARDARVRVRKSRGILEVEDWAVALEDGDRGDVIRVRGERTKVTELVRIVGREEANFLRFAEERIETPRRGR